MAAPVVSSPLVYCHGLPGGSAEWAACAPTGQAAFAPDRNRPVSAAALAAQIRAAFGQSPVTLIGFSPGAPIVLSLARELGEQAGYNPVATPAPRRNVKGGFPPSRE